MSPPKKTKQVFLVPQVIDDDSDDATVLYVCDAVKASVAKRSSLLSGLLDTSGVVQIPEGIGFDDFRLWAKAGQAVKLSDQDLATVVRVRCSPQLYSKRNAGMKCAQLLVICSLSAQSRCQWWHAPSSLLMRLDTGYRHCR